MLLLLVKEYSILPNDPHLSLSDPLYRSRTLIIHVQENRDFSISDDRMYKALLKTVREPVARITKICCRVIDHVRTRLEPKKGDLQGHTNSSCANGNVNVPLVDGSETASVIEELEKAIKEFDNTELLCNQALEEMGLDTKPRDELFMVFTFLFCMREISRKLLKLARYQEELCKLRKSTKRIWWPSVGFFTLLSSPRYDDFVHIPEKGLLIELPSSLDSTHH
ncbi:hypothetical protein K493DRAFT_29652 [Basidiobolus meristosporus CBS 931.73]|uniref:Uncharacterized protein n=1 Tax=Basidiobolus meristosporus CBS 931.73 TaxID=1314790 RepID=A0A1Y1Z6X5_9FUNG|nr:hypothetical protein K493DRAFT_29652 [Basidiobolus meristosporus CBS 931.73]|eukprot:ORY06000.1 hypothetical protein K493DRAFT_29652 [Basidiobolus meristosporus CBS 931.73]